MCVYLLSALVRGYQSCSVCSRLEGCGVTLQEYNLSRSGMQSVTLRNAICHTQECTKKLYMHMFLSAVVALVVSLSQHQMAKVVTGARKKELGAWCENRGEDKA